MFNNLILPNLLYCIANLVVYRSALAVAVQEAEARGRAEALASFHVFEADHRAALREKDDQLKALRQLRRPQFFFAKIDGILRGVRCES